MTILAADRPLDQARRKLAFLQKRGAASGKGPESRGWELGLLKAYWESHESAAGLVGPFKLPLSPQGQPRQEASRTQSTRYNPAGHAPYCELGTKYGQVYSTVLSWGYVAGLCTSLGGASERHGYPAITN